MSKKNIFKKGYYYLVDIGLYKFIPDDKYISKVYKKKMNRELDLESPKSFNEKIQWLKIYDRKPIYSTMVDKYEAKKYVSNIIGEEYIIPTIGVWNSFDDINFDELPNQFVLKCTHDSGGLFICRDKKNIDLKKIKRKFNLIMKRNFYYRYREWAYKNVEPRIIAEQYMQDGDNRSLKDYKFFCFNGVPKYLYVSEGLENHATARIGFFDMDFNIAPFRRSDYKNFSVMPKKPINFEKMKELSKVLSKKTSFLRVDFYEINGKIYFGELTLYPCGGYMPFEPLEWDEKLGSMIELEKTNY